MLLRLVGLMNVMLFYPIHQHSRRELCLDDFIREKNPFNTGLCSGIYTPVCFKLGNDDRHYYSVYFDISLNELGLHSRSQIFEKSKTSALICLQIPELI